MTVAYYLILDHKRRKMLGSSPIMHATQQQARYLVITPIGRRPECTPRSSR